MPPSCGPSRASGTTVAAFAVPVVVSAVPEPVEGSSIGFISATILAITTVRIIVLVPLESSFTNGIIPQR